MLDRGTNRRSGLLRRSGQRGPVAVGLGLGPSGDPDLLSIETDDDRHIGPRGLLGLEVGQTVDDEGNHKDEHQSQQQPDFGIRRHGFTPFLPLHPFS
ncbi:MAG TPA: hypothetical protein PK373_01375, partial [Sedimentisphaerales bacterium]|nr:hypothetical protein [Sedimentisphaerales bacterium]